MIERSEYAPSSDARVASVRAPSWSQEAEQAVLGGLMLDKEALDRIASVIETKHFYRLEHRHIFDAVLALGEKGQACDALTVVERLDQEGRLDEAGGQGYLYELVDNTPGAANIVAYAEIVRERAILRELASAGSDIADSALRPEGREPAEILDDAERRILEIGRQGGKEEFVPIHTLLTKAFERINELNRSGSTLTGLSTGFRDLDHKTAGLQAGDLIIVAGRPSMGKTSFAMNMVEEAAIKGEITVAVFSMEMPAEQLTMRMLSSLGRIDQQKVRTGRLDSDDWPRLTAQLTLLEKTRIFMVDDPAMTPNDIRARCRRLKREQGLELVVVDYLQLMHVPGSRENRATEISEISRSLKSLAKELMVPVVALSQLNRGLEQRTDKRPVMSDLRESGAIEQDADLILFIYRDEVYNENSDDKGKAEIIIGKQRNGPIGRVDLAFLSQYTRFENYARDDYSRSDYKEVAYSDSDIQD